MSIKQGMFIDPPSTLLRKPTAAPTVTPAECSAIALTATEWKPGGIMDPDGVVVRHVLKALHQGGWKIEPL